MKPPILFSNNEFSTMDNARIIDINGCEYSDIVNLEDIALAVDISKNTAISYNNGVFKRASDYFDMENVAAFYIDVFDNKKILFIDLDREFIKK